MPILGMLLAVTGCRMGKGYLLAFLVGISLTAFL
jgi:hypothetical protein